MNGKPYSPADDAILHREDLTLAQMCDLLGRSLSSVKARRRRVGAALTDSWTKAEDEFILEHPDWSAASAGERLGRSASAVAQRRRKLPARHWHGGRKQPWQGGGRRLIAQTCVTCGHLRQSEEFYARSDGSSTLGECTSCAVARARAGFRVRQEATLPAQRTGYVWTGLELELATRPDLSVMQIAQMLGRSYTAVLTARTKIRRDPRYGAQAGTVSRWAS